MYFKKNKYLFLDILKNAQIFLSEIGYFEHDHRFLFNREMANIRRCKYLRQDNIRFSHSHKNEEYLGRVSPSHFQKNVLIEMFLFEKLQIFVLKLLSLLS